MNLAIQTKHISKVYDASHGWRLGRKEAPLTAVDDVNLSVPEGELYGLLGPNGAGKTTLVKMLCTLILPTTGTASVAGASLRDERKIRAVSGLVVSDERSFFWRLSVRRNLNFFATMHGLYGWKASSRIDAVLHDVGLVERAHQRFSDLSSGMRQRLAIARALLHQPKVLFLDEPTRSLDPIATQKLHDLIRRVMVERKMTVLLITHDLAEAEKLCDRVALMHQARIQKTGRPADLRRELNPEVFYTLVVGPLTVSQISYLQEQIPDLQWSNRSSMDDACVIKFQAGEQDGILTAVIDYLRQNDVRLFKIEAKPPSLEDVFAYYTRERFGAKS
jgi:ABC-2 type transport system ATP-binding protein